jgi:hypothetical protein
VDVLFVLPGYVTGYAEGKLRVTVDQEYAGHSNARNDGTQIKPYYFLHGLGLYAPRQ